MKKINRGGLRIETNRIKKSHAARFSVYKFVALSLVVLSFVGMTSVAKAQKTLLERNISVTSKDKNMISARAEMVSEAYLQATQDLVKEIIGESKYNRNKALISQKILKNTARFIPFSKTGEIKSIEPEGFMMTVNLKVSVTDLQSLLLENGLFYQSDSTPMILSTIRLNDRLNAKNYVWWYAKDKTDRSFLVRQSKLMEEKLKMALARNSFYLLRTQQFRYGDSGLDFPKSDSIRLENWQSIAQKMGAQIQIMGDVNISASTEKSESFSVGLNLTAVQVMNGRIIAEITRHFETEAGSFQLVLEKRLPEIFENASTDISAQILEAWQKGALGSELFKVKVLGRLPLLQQENLKEIIKSKLREVKTVKERLISAESLVFEVDASIGAQDLAQKMPEIDLGNETQLVLQSSIDKEVIYRLNKK